MESAARTEITEAVLAELRARFGETRFRRGVHPVIAAFPAAHADVGDVEVSDDGDEATLTIGSITHMHFNHLHLPLAEAAPMIATEIADFLEMLFADEVYLWSGRHSGGCKWPASRETCKVKWRTKGFFWSGPVS